jgi:hypothetical protein
MIPDEPFGSDARGVTLGDQMAYRSRVFVRTSNAVYEGTITLPVRTRLKEFLARPQPTFVLTDVVTTASTGALVEGSKRTNEMNVFKNHVQFMTTVEEVKNARGKSYERDVVAAKMVREVYLFRMNAGFVIQGDILGGEQTILYHKGSFLAVVQPSIVDRNGRELERGFSFVLINLAALESFTRLSRIGDAMAERTELAEAEHVNDTDSEPEQEMDFSDFEEQFVRVDKPVQVPTSRQ